MAVKSFMLLFLFTSHHVYGTWIDSPVCGYFSATNVSTRSARIFEGDEPYPGEFPWVVFIRITKTETWSKCTGGILESHWILTAAHCVEKAHGAIVDIAYGRINPLKKGIPGGARRVKGNLAHNIFLPPNRVRMDHHDVALIYLRDLPGIPLPTTINEIGETNRMCLLPNGPFPFAKNNVVNVAGYGQKLPPDDGMDAANRHFLTKTELFIETQQICARFYNNFEESQQFCARNPNPPFSHICEGDSGAPVVFFEPAAQEAISSGTSKRRAVTIGVISRTKSHCGDTSLYHKTVHLGGLRIPSVSMRIAPYVKWIDEIVMQFKTKVAETPEPSSCVIC